MPKRGYKQPFEVVEKKRKRMIGNKYALGKRRSQETRERVSKSKRGEKNPFYGKHHSPGTRMKISENTRLALQKPEIRIKLGFKKEKHWNWKGGITPISHLIRECFKYKQWILDVFKRDNFTCQLCGDRKSGNLVAHHMKMFNLILIENNIKSIEDALFCKELWSVKNGITLCKKCHIILHAQTKFN